jgi:hypothetical protein
MKETVLNRRSNQMAEVAEDEVEVDSMDGGGGGDRAVS